MKVGARYQVLIISILSLLLLFASIPTPCNARSTKGVESQRVMFRDDDVTPWTLNALKAVNQVHTEAGVPVTLGVIPARSFSAQTQSPPLQDSGSTRSSGIIERAPVTLDVTQPLALQSPNRTSNSSFNSPFAEYMRSLASSGLFELAQHGYDHRDNSKQYGVSVPSEFRGMPYAEQYALIEGGRSLMQSAFGAAPTTFIPPFNTGDENTLKALAELGFTVYSSYSGEFKPTSEGHLTFEPQQVSLDVDKGSENNTFEFLVGQTEPLLNDSGVHDIVVEYHNWFFKADQGEGVNATKLDVLRDYIQYLKTKNVMFTTLNGTTTVNDTVGLQLAGSPSNSVQTSTLFATLQAGDQWLWVILALAAPIAMAMLLLGLTKLSK